MPYIFKCRYIHRCSCPVCICPRQYKTPDKMKKQLSEKAEEALDLIEFIKKNGGDQIGQKYEKAESFIRENGDVSTIFLDNLRKVKSNTTPER